MASTVFNPFTKRLDYVGANVNITQAGTVVRAVVTPATDGVTTVFTTPDAYVTGTLLVFVNGIMEHFFTETSSTTFTLSTAPVTGDYIHVFYATSTGGGVTSSHYELEDGTGAYLAEDGSFLTLE
jgi:hypothetical protein